MDMRQDGAGTQFRQPDMLFKRYGHSSGVRTPASGSEQPWRGQPRPRSGSYATEGHRRSRAYTHVVAWRRVLVAGGWATTHMGSSFTTVEPFRLAVQIPCRTPPSHSQAPVSGHELGRVRRFIEAAGQPDRMVYRRGDTGVAGGTANHARWPAALFGLGDQHGSDDAHNLSPGAVADRGADRIRHRTAWA
jgi:hypothetical protein